MCSLAVGGEFPDDDPGADGADSAEPVLESPSVLDGFEVAADAALRSRRGRVEPVAPAGVAEAVEVIVGGIEKLRATGLEPASVVEAQGLVREVERVARQLDAVRVEVFNNISATGVHAHDGHTSVRAFVRHQADLTTRDAAVLARCANALSDLPGFADAYAAGQVGTAQVNRMAIAHSNVRVREQLIASEELFLEHAKAQTSAWFDGFVADWVRIVDQDGTEQASEKGHRNRRFSMTQDFDGNWAINGLGPSLAGAEVEEILAAYVRAELADDWDAAKEEHGEDAREKHLPRTSAQRRWDAFEAMAKDAAATPADAKRPGIVTNIVLDAATFETTLARLLGHDGELDLFDSGEPSEDSDLSEAESTDTDLADPVDPTDGFVCQTLGGHPVNPVDATIAALTGHIRRTVVGSDSVVIDLGRRKRLFTGSSRMAVWLSSTECFHPSCNRKGPHLEVDHTREWAARAGPTNQTNATPACKFHNQWKQRTGHRVKREPNGTWTTTRPNGTTIT